MATMNRVFLAGNLTRDLEVRYTPSGTAVTDMGLAVNESYRNKAGELVETTVFVDIVVWGRQAETSAEYLSKGSPVLVEGRLILDSWQTDSGEKRSRLRVRADRVQFLGRPRRGEYADAPEGAAPPKRGRKEAAAPAPPAEEEPGPSNDSGDSEDLPF